METIVPGVAVTIAPSIVRITAPNPGVMTGPGTNSYIVGDERLVLVDPGPEIESHIALLCEAVRGRLEWIVCTHTHLDHSPAAKAVKAATGARIAGRTTHQDGPQDGAFAPDRVLEDGDVIAVPGFTLRAVRTPGHASNHVCYYFEEQKLLFTGDHVMQGSTVVISPPDGDMQAYFASLEKLYSLDIAAFAPGHGRLITTPHDEVRRLIAHRLKREEKVLGALRRKTPATLDELVPLAYDDVPEKLYPPARRSLHAHLIKLAREGRVLESGDEWALEPPSVSVSGGVGDEESPRTKLSGAD
jgi:glyoxylase-like metal-dependent hydrolase (beta-lactamase superfamily II)